VARPADLPEEWGDEADNEIGLRVIDVDRGDIGTVADVIVTGANDVWVLRNGPYGEVLIPVIDDVVLEIDEVEGTASVRLLPGLIDERETGS
jgi:16S rRNA processing protein RimM